MAAGKQFGHRNTTSLNHEGHEVTRRKLNYANPSCPFVVFVVYVPPGLSFDSYPRILRTGTAV